MDSKVVETKEDGSLYAEGARLMQRPVRSPYGVTLGGTVAECDSAKVAATLARCWDEHARMQAVLNSVVAAHDTMTDAPRMDLVNDALAVAVEDARALLHEVEAADA